MTQQSVALPRPLLARTDSSPGQQIDVKAALRSFELSLQRISLEDVSALVSPICDSLRSNLQNAMGGDGESDDTSSGTPSTPPPDGDSVADQFQEAKLYFSFVVRTVCLNAIGQEVLTDQEAQWCVSNSEEARMLLSEIARDPESITAEISHIFVEMFIGLRMEVLFHMTSHALEQDLDLDIAPITLLLRNRCLQMQSAREDQETYTSLQREVLQGISSLRVLSGQE